MTLKRMFLLLIFFLSSASQPFAQTNELRARVEYEDAERAYSEKKYEKAIEHLEQAEGLLGSWNVKIGYLKILALDQVVNYNSDNRLTELQRQMTAYMLYADTYGDQLVPQQFKQVYEIERKLKKALQIDGWKRMPEFVSGQKSFESNKYEEALKQFEQAAEKGNVLAMSKVGHMYLNGWGAAKNYTNAERWLLIAADEEIPESYRYLAAIYLRKESGKTDPIKGEQYLKLGAEKGDSYAMNWLGKIYAYDKKNYSEGIKWFKKSSELNNMLAFCNLGILYEFGTGVTANGKEALDFYLKSYELGYMEAGYRIGGLYEKGVTGIIQNKTTAFNWYLKTAEKDYEHSIEKTAQAYAKNLGSGYDPVKAIEWYLKLAKIRKDEKLEIEIYAEAFFGNYNYPPLSTLNGDSKLLDEFARAYTSGNKSFERRLSLLPEKPILMKDVIAKAYLQGWGVERNKKTAKMWERMP